jgi:hypothetical protein
VQISVRRRKKVTIFDLSGDVDFANSRQLRRSVLREIQENRTPGRGKAHRGTLDRQFRCRFPGGGPESVTQSRCAVHFVRASTPAREVLQLSLLIKVFEIYETEEQAAAS